MPSIAAWRCSKRRAICAHALRASLGAWDVIGIGPTDIVLLQVKSNDRLEPRNENAARIPRAIELPKTFAYLVRPSRYAGREGGRMNWMIDWLIPSGLALCLVSCIWICLHLAVRR